MNFLSCHKKIQNYYVILVREFTNHLFFLLFLFILNFSVIVYKKVKKKKKAHIFPTQESNQGLLHCRQFLYQLSCEESPINISNIL